MSDYSAVNDLIQNAPFPLPDDYVDFLRARADEGPTLEAGEYVDLWAAGEVLSLNDAYKTADFALGLLLIGTNGANAAFGIDGRRGGIRTPQTWGGRGAKGTFCPPSTVL